MSEIVTVRDIGTVTAEILTIRRQVNQMVLNGAIEIGRRLVEAKEMLPHGAWGTWLREEVDFSQSSAQNFIRLFEEYGDAQITLEGAVAKSQTLGNLPYTKALKLLVVPEEEREEMAEEAQKLSTRELERVIRERDEARKRAEEAEAEAEEREGNLDELRDRLQEAQKAAEEAAEREEPERQRLQAALRKAEDRADELRVESAKQAAEAAELQGKLKKTKDMLKALKENPKVPDDLLEKIRAEEAEAAAKQAEAALEEKLREASAAEKTLEAERTEKENELQGLRERLEAAEKKARLASPETAVFAALFQGVQEDWNKLRGALMKAENADAETGERLRAAVAAMLDKWGKELSA